MAIYGSSLEKGDICLWNQTVGLMQTLATCTQHIYSDSHFVLSLYVHHTLPKVKIHF